MGRPAHNDPKLGKREKALKFLGDWIDRYGMTPASRSSIKPTAIESDVRRCNPIEAMLQQRRDERHAQEKPKARRKR